MVVNVPDVPDNVKRLLVIRQSALGDIVNALYSLRAIRKAYPSATSAGWSMIGSASSSTRWTAWTR